MEKFVPYAKLSKKKKRELDARRRGTWGGLNPVTRKSPDPRAYNRKKVRRRGFDEPGAVPFLFGPAPESRERRSSPGINQTVLSGRKKAQRPSGFSPVFLLFKPDRR